MAKQKPIDRDRFRESTYNIRQIHENSSDNLTIFNIQLPSDPAQKLHDLIKSGFSAEQPVLQLSHDLSKELPKNAKITGSMLLGGKEFPISIKSDLVRQGEIGKKYSIYYNNSRKSSKDMYYRGDVGMKMEFEKCLNNSNHFINKIKHDVVMQKEMQKEARTLGKNKGDRSQTPKNNIRDDRRTPIDRRVQNINDRRTPIDNKKKLAQQIISGTQNTRMVVGSPVNYDLKDEQLREILIHLLADQNYRKIQLTIFFKQKWTRLSEILYGKVVSNNIDSVIKKSETILSALVDVIDRNSMEYKLKKEYYRNVDPEWKGYNVFESKAKNIKEKVSVQKEEIVKILRERGAI